MEKAKEDERVITEICNYIEYMLKEKEIEKFKQVRKINYYEIVRKIAKAEEAIHEYEEEFWGRIGGEESMKKDKIVEERESLEDEGKDSGNYTYENPLMNVGEEKMLEKEIE